MQEQRKIQTNMLVVNGNQHHKATLQSTDVHYNPNKP